MKHTRFIPSGEMSEDIPENHISGRPYEITLDSSFDTSSVTGREEIEYEMIDPITLSNKTRL